MYPTSRIMAAILMTTNAVMTAELCSRVALVCWYRACILVHLDCGPGSQRVSGFGVPVFPGRHAQSPLPARQRGDIRLQSQAASDRDLRPGSPVPCGAYQARRVFPTRYLFPLTGGSVCCGASLLRVSQGPGWMNQAPCFASATSWTLFSWPLPHQGRFRPHRGSSGHDSRFPANLRLTGNYRGGPASSHPYPGGPGSSNAHAVVC